ncbi:hypothetical protein NGRRMQZB_75 [Escherichia phage Dru_SM1]
MTCKLSLFVSFVIFCSRPCERQLIPIGTI